MDSDDIRKQFPISESRDIRAAVALETRPPLCSPKGKNSGLDCLITVLRRIYSHSMLGPDGLAAKEWFSAAELENPILSHAWHTFGQGKEEKKRGLKARAALLRSLQGMGMTGSEPFCDLDRSPLMARTFWGQSEMVLFHPRFDGETLETIPCTAQEKGEQSLVQVNRQTDSPTIQDRLQVLFGAFTKDGRSLIMAPARPEIIRVEYLPADDPASRPPFHSFRHADFPAWKFHNTEDGDAYFNTTGKVPYTLIVVVRHRDGPTGNDSVRTYGANGANIVPEYEPRGYTPGSWSLEDEKPSMYTLFYGRSHPDMLPLQLWPELNARVVNLDLWDRVEETLQHPSSSLWAQTTGGAPRKEPETAPRQSEAPAATHDREKKGGREQQATRQGKEGQVRPSRLPGRASVHSGENVSEAVKARVMAAGDGQGSVKERRDK